MFEDYSDIITVVELAKMLNIGKSSAYTLLKENKIRHIRIGKKYVIPKNSVIGFVNDLCYNGNQIINGGLPNQRKETF